jgi:hypothetical protein
MSIFIWLNYYVLDVGGLILNKPISEKNQL